MVNVDPLIWHTWILWDRKIMDQLGEHRGNSWNNYMENIWRFPQMGVSQNGWLIFMENPIVRNGLGVAPILGNFHVRKSCNHIWEDYGQYGKFQEVMGVPPNLPCLKDVPQITHPAIEVPPISRRPRSAKMVISPGLVRS